MPRLPKRLERPPLMEAVVELRFSPSQESVGDILPGLLYGKLKHLFEKVEPLPINALPREMRLATPDLAYRPRIRLAGEPRALLIGDQVVTISRTPPYSGWAAFKTLCEEVLRAIHETDLVRALQRFSLKCVNILDLVDRHPFALLNAELRLADHDIGARRPGAIGREMAGDERGGGA